MRKGDHITIGHVFNHNKDYLPLDMRPDNIKAKYEAIVIGFGDKTSKFSWEELKDNSSTKE